jgi:hypothetical protein
LKDLWKIGNLDVDARSNHVQIYRSSISAVQYLAFQGGLFYEGETDSPERAKSVEL